MVSDEESTGGGVIEANFEPAGYATLAVRHGNARAHRLGLGVHERDGLGVFHVLVCRDHPLGDRKKCDFLLFARVMSDSKGSESRGVITRQGAHRAPRRRGLSSMTAAAHGPSPQKYI